MTTLLVRTIVIVGCTLPLSGCGGSKSCTVEGKVTFQGKLLVCGVVNLYGAEGAFAAGGIDPDGNFTVRDAPIGSVKISVVSDKPVPMNAEDSKKPPAGSAPPARMPDPAKWFPIDAKYNDPETSGKVANLTGGKNTVDITLE